MNLVTGGGGFIGSHLTRALVKRGDRVRVLDNLSTGSRQRLADVVGDVEWIEGDIRDAETVQRACAGVDTVYHHAAIASVARSVEEPGLTNDVNICGTLNMLSAARDCGARRLVFASSSAVYGAIAATPKAETLPTVPTSPYGIQKMAGELYVSSWYTLYGLETVALRYFNVFGPGQDPRGGYAAVIPRWIAAALASEPVTIYGNGEQSRDFIHVSDVVAINLVAAAHPAAAGAVFNVGTGQSSTLLTLADEIGRAVGRRLAVHHEPVRAGDLFESVADTTRLRSVLGYTPATDFAGGIANTVDGYLSERTAGAT
jgi:UDP-glucose 4-epimerase